MRSALWLTLLLAIPTRAAEPVPAEKLFARGNLCAWCIVPFDGKKRGPEARVAMLQQLGFTKYAYDWRAEHLPTFEKELVLLKEAKIELQAVWFPAGIGKDGQFLLDALKKHGVRTELWVMLPQPDVKLDQEAKVKAAAAQLKPLAQTAAKQGCKVAIYNHGGWTGEPANMVAVAKAVQEPNVGIAYNLHHGHDQLPQLGEHLKLMLPYLSAVNLNGMDSELLAKGGKILVLGQGQDDLSWLRILQQSGYFGPLGILGHTNNDAADQLADNLAGLDYLVARLAKQSPDQPGVRTSSPRGLTIRLVPGSAPESRIVQIGNFTADERKVWDKTPPTEEHLRQCCSVILVPDEVKPQAISSAPTLLGDFRVVSGEIQFSPRFALVPGLRYRVSCDRAKLFGKPGSERYSSDFVLPFPTGLKPPTLDGIAPSADKWPENTLRVYLQFSTPMTRGGIYQYLQLLQEDGKPVKWPFLELDEELWSPDGKRLTLLFDPGRVKRGLKPREEDGPILEEGKKYTLVVSAKWKDEHGQPLKAEVRKSIFALPPDDRPVDPDQWKIVAPTKDRPVLQVTFEKPLDRALAKRMLSVLGPDGKPLPFEGTVAADERSWSLADSTLAWKPGTYQLVADTRLEDVCGNRIGQAFEVDVFKPIQKKIEGKTIQRAFTVK
jgi:hypothetical protein